MFELPAKFKTARGHLNFTTTDTGDHYVIFSIEDEDWEIAESGKIVGFTVPATIDSADLARVLTDIRDRGGARFIVVEQASGKRT